jgi:hypothetical protein
MPDTETYLSYLLSLSKEQLVNDIYNDEIREYADFADGDSANDTTTGKRIPYIGWFWRDTDFAERNITIGKATVESGYAESGYVGVMEKNKWDYPERQMTPEEAATFIDFLEQARKARSAYRVEVAQRQANFESVCAGMRAWFQTLVVEE